MHPGTVRDLHWTEYWVGVPCHGCPQYVYFERHHVVENLDPAKYFLCHDCHERNLQRNRRTGLDALAIGAREDGSRR